MRLKGGFKSYARAVRTRPSINKVLVYSPETGFDWTWQAVPPEPGEIRLGRICYYINPTTGESQLIYPPTRAEYRKVRAAIIALTQERAIAGCL